MEAGIASQMVQMAPVELGIVNNPNKTIQTDVGMLDDPNTLEFAQYLFPVLIKLWQQHVLKKSKMHGLREFHSNQKQRPVRVIDTENWMPWDTHIWTQVIQEQQQAENPVALRCIVHGDGRCFLIDRLFSIGVGYGILAFRAQGQQTVVLLSLVSWLRESALQVDEMVVGEEEIDGRSGVRGSASTFAKSYINLVSVS